MTTSHVSVTSPKGVFWVLTVWKAILFEIATLPPTLLPSSPAKLPLMVPSSPDMRLPDSELIETLTASASVAARMRVNA